MLGYVLWSRISARAPHRCRRTRRHGEHDHCRASGSANGGERRAGAPSATIGIERPATLLPEPVKLAALEPVSEGPEIGRNPFAYGQTPPAAAASAAATTTTSAGPPPPPPPPPPIPVSYIGIVGGSDGRSFGSFRIKVGENVMIEIAFEGQVLVGQYRVLKVDTDVGDGRIHGRIERPRALMKGAEAAADDLRVLSHVFLRRVASFYGELPC